MGIAASVDVSRFTSSVKHPDIGVRPSSFEFTLRQGETKMQNQQNLTYRTPLPWRRKLAAFWSKMNRGLAFGVIMFGALLAFELFNYTTTDFALQDFLGDIRFLGLRWAMILAVAFCGMDFAGIARLFTPAGEKGARVEVWYLLGAWFLAATMNAMLTWWGVSLALLQHQALGNEILSREQLIRIVPVFVAVLVWLIRILMIGTFSMAGERLFARAEEALRPAAPSQPRPITRSAADVAPRPVRMLGVADEDDFGQTSRERPARESRYREELPREERPRPVTPPPPEVRRVTVERPSVQPVMPPMPAVRPAPKPSAATAQALGANGMNGAGARPVAARPAPVNGQQDLD
jgi:hypothetical protein